MLFGLCFAVLSFVLDQFSKLYVARLFATNSIRRNWGEYFNLTEAWNTGVSFSMFGNNGTMGAILLTVFSLAVVAVLVYWLKNEQNRLAQASLGLMIGGALGNIADRVQYGAVYDFLDFHYAQWHWPTFNVADMFICIGAFAIVIIGLLDRHKISLKEGVK